MARNPHAFVNRISAAAGGRKEYSAGAANVLLILATLLVVGCRSGCDGAAYNEIISMPEILAFDPAFDLLQQAVIEQVVETEESQVIRLELLRRDHHPSLTDSTSTQPPKSSVERFLEAVKRSHARRDAIARSMQSAPKSSNSVKPSSIPVTTQGEGEYLTQIGLGTPKKTLTLIVDTGSDLVWTQCLACKSCYSQIDPIFNPAKSSTYKSVKCGINLCQDLYITACPAAGCQYVYEYGDGSSTIGNFATDTVTLGNASVPSLGFGCGHDQTGSFTGADGIVGFGQGPLSLISQLFNKGVTSKRFSYCLVNMDSQNTSPLLLGDPAVTSAPPGVAYTPIQANPFNPTYYYLNLTGISVSGTPVKYPDGTFAIDSTSGNGGLIIDSGTTITYLATAGYNAVIAAVKANLTYPLVSGSEYGLDVCFDIGNAPTLPLPTIVFHFTGKVDVVLQSQNLYVLVDTTGPIICLAIAGNDGFSIFGNIQQQNKLIVYDLNPQKFQIGFKSITCGNWL